MSTKCHIIGFIAAPPVRVGKTSVALLIGSLEGWTAQKTGKRACFWFEGYANGKLADLILRYWSPKRRFYAEVIWVTRRRKFRGMKGSVQFPVFKMQTLQWIDGRWPRKPQEGLSPATAEAEPVTTPAEDPDFLMDIPFQLDFQPDLTDEHSE